MKLFKFTSIFIFYILCISGCATSKYTTPSTVSSVNLIKKSELREEVILFSLGLLNIQYTWGSQKPDFGLDCSGLVSYVYKNVANISLPHKASLQVRYGREISISELKPGDLLFFNTTGKDFSHVGIYIGDNKFIHAPKTGDNVKISLFENYYKKKFQKAVTLFS